MTTVMTRSATRILLGPILMIAIGVLIKGYADIGDGFAAGVIASLGIILQGIAFGADEFERLPLVRFAPVAAILGVFLSALVAFMPVLFGEPIFRHWPPAGDHASHFGALELITPVVFDVGVFLVVIGFCVGAMTSIARALVRQERADGPHPPIGDHGVIERERLIRDPATVVEQGTGGQDRAVQSTSDVDGGQGR